MCQTVNVILKTKNMSLIERNNILEGPALQIFLGNVKKCLRTLFKNYK